MTFATWWRSDPLPNLSPLSPFSTHISTDTLFIASFTTHDPHAIATRLQRGNHCYLAFMSDVPVAYPGPVPA